MWACYAFFDAGNVPYAPPGAISDEPKNIFFHALSSHLGVFGVTKKNHVTFTVWAIERKSDFDGVEKKHFFGAHEYHEFLHNIHFVCFPSQKFEILNI